MKTKFLIILALALSIVPALAQEAKPAADLKDDFGAVGCGDLQARLDSFIAQLNNEPAAQGFIVLYPQGAKRRPVYQRMQEILSHLKARKFDHSRIWMIEGAARPQASTQFWLVPPGADIPKTMPEDEQSLSDSPAGTDSLKAFKFGSTSTDAISGCGENAFDLEAYSRAIKAFPGSSGRVIIKTPTAAKFQRARKEVETELTGFGLQPTQIKIVHVKSSSGSTELWIMPHAFGLLK
jgi:hypothetical protein